MIYCFYLFDRNGVCLYYEDWHRVKRPKNLPEEQKLIFGLLFSLKATVCAMRPGGDGKLVPDALQSYNTSTYKLHYYETPTGLRFILITDPPVPSLRECLRQIYSHIYVEYVTKKSTAGTWRSYQLHDFLAELEQVHPRAPILHEQLKLCWALALRDFTCPLLDLFRPDGLLPLSPTGTDRRQGSSH
mmetsp:Transcript_50045/g.156628  ORF Transcript_50045/g.156628 Transcript_50045/m.156628 type:complete len:187 (-) Transcript_50045:477-1037(-)